MQYKKKYKWFSKNIGKYRTTTNILRKKIISDVRKGKLIEYEKELILWIGYAITIDTILVYLYTKK